MTELAKITAVGRYEERMLFSILHLADPTQRLVYVTSQAVDPAIVDYYLRFLPDPQEARSRLSMITLDDPDIRPLSQKLLARPDLVGEIRDLAGGSGHAYVLPFNVGAVDQALAEALGLPLHGPRPDLAWLGSKSGARKIARRAGVAVLPGDEDLFSATAVEAAIAAIRRQRPEAESVVIKLNNGFSGQGNVMVAIEAMATASDSLVDSPTTFCASEESWRSFLPKIEAEGAIVEELARRPGLTSPSVQLRVSTAGALEVVSTHDQVLGGPGQQVYLGCRFPAEPTYRGAIRDQALRVGRVLAAEGVVGWFGIDFLVVPDDSGARIYLSEINLRAGGTTHPFWMARLAMRARYDDATGELTSAGTSKSYMASDNVKSELLVGVTPARMIEIIDLAGLAYDPGSRTGATLHLLGALQEFGKMGVTCIADSREEADDLYKQVVETALGATGFRER
ncbi:MAG: peptide ligase PGM1-related protein [Actinomycetota bacterium]|nr:peptide ligase PGM1-related protein [Actinomycetota bacterium]